MATDYYLQLSSTVPLRTISGVPNSIWTYTLSWSDQPARRRPVDPGPRLALTFSSRINICDPKDLPDVSLIQDTQLEKPISGDVQYIYRDVQGRNGNTLVFCFVAPSEVDTFTVVRLSQKTPVTAPWTDLPFTVSPQVALALQQVISGPAVICPSVAMQTPLVHSARTIQKATIGSFLPTTESLTNSLQPGNALTKFRFVRQLLLQPGEVNTAKQHLAANFLLGTDSVTSLPDSMWDQLALFETDPNRSLPHPPLGALAEVPLDALKIFGEAISVLRKRAVDSIRNAAVNHDTRDNTGTKIPINKMAVQSGQQTDLKALTALSRAASMANKGLSLNAFSGWIQPFGYMDLERLEMTPAGIVRGELIATIPLAPLEETAVVQKEWSVTSKEFTSIVTDSLENYSETGVTDNTELAQSTTSQNQHSNQFNITGTVSGGIAHIFDAQASSGFTVQDSSSESATASAKHSQTLTQKASSRVKQEHKVTISTTTVTGTSESTTRTLKNTDPSNPIRIDYFRMMREWRVRLYRYGLRLTYDLAVPEPGGALRQAYAYLEWLKGQIGPFQFNVAHFPPNYVKSKSDPNYSVILKLADQYYAQIPPFPEPPAPITTVTHLNNDTDANSIQDEPLKPIDVPQRFWIENLFITIRINKEVNGAVRVYFTDYPEQKNTDSNGTTFGPDDLTSYSGFMYHASGNIALLVSHYNCKNSGVQLEAFFSPTDETINNWLSDVWTALYNAAQTQYYMLQQDIAAKIAQLEDRLTNVDTLTLRREESEEIMKLTVATLLGKYTGQFWQYLQIFADQANPAPWPPIPDPINTFGQNLDLNLVDPKQFIVKPGSFGSAFSKVFDQKVYSLLPWIGDDEVTARFINQAIEWENVVTFLYSYFWDNPDSWDFIRNIQHQDPTRQSFLRAGSARVVLTVRKGWEEMWTTFVNTGAPYSIGKETQDGGSIPYPYLTIAQEIAAYDDRNYPGIPPANPNQSAVRLEEAVYTTSSTQLNPSLQPQDIVVLSSVGFLVGAQVVIDSGVGEGYPKGSSGKQESTTITAIADATHITLASIQNPHGGDGLGYAVVQPGEKGVLIAEWNEYTPTSGTDIAVTSNLATIA